MLYLIAVPVEYTVHGTEHIHHPDPPAGNPVPVTSTHSRKILSCMLIQKLLGLVNLRRQKGTPPTIRMIQKHKLAVILADFVFGQGTFSVSVSFSPTHTHTDTQREKYREGDARKFQDQRGFTTSHPGLESSTTVSQDQHHTHLVVDTRRTLCKMLFRQR